MKKIMVLMMALLMLIGLVACTPAQPTEAPAAEPQTEAAASSTEENAGKASKAETTTITWMTCRSSWDVMKEIVNDYMAENPNVKVEFEVISDRSSYNQKLKILAASQELPTLFDSEGDATLEEIAATGALVNVDDMYADLGYNDMSSIGLNYARLSDGNLYTMSWENNIEYFWYNKEIFASAGIEKTPETFDELLATCEQLKAAGYNGFAVWPGWELCRYVAMVPYRLTGNDLIDGLTAGTAKMNSEAGLAGATFFQKAAQYFQPGWATSDYSGALETFQSGNAAMYYIGTWQFKSFCDENLELLDKYGFFYLPTCDGAVTSATEYFANAGTGTSLNAAKYDDTVKNFVKYVLEHYTEKAFFEFGTVPAAAFDTNAGKCSEFFKQVLADGNAMTGSAKCWDVVLPTATGEALQNALIDLGMNQTTPEQFADLIDASVAENVG